MHYAWIALAAALLAGEAPGFRAESAGRSLTLSGCLVTLIDEVEVAAQEQGTLTELAVAEGQQVKEGDLLARIDDKQVRAMAEVAQYKLDVANEEAGNDVNKRYAEKAADVAKAELEGAVETNRRAPGAISQTEIRRLALQHEQFLLQIEQAVYELGIAETTIKVREAELKAANEDVARRQILAPVDGVVEKINHRRGEWVQPGEMVVKVLRVDSLWVEGYVDALRYTPGDVRGRPVMVTVALPGRQEQFQGKISFASELIEVGPRFLIKAEVQNRQDSRTGEWLLRSGLTATMTISLP